MSGRSDVLRIGFSLLASIALLGWTMRAGFAEDAGAGAHDDAKPSYSSEGANGSRAAGGDSAGGATNTDPQGHGEGGDAKQSGGPTNPGASLPAPAGKSVDDIDTRISVQPRRLNSKLGHAGDGKATIESPATRNLHRRTFLLSRPSNPIVRNAVGASVPQHQGMDRGEHSVPLGVPHNPAAATTGDAEGAGGRFAKAEGHIDHRMPGLNPPGGSTVPHYGAINGTGLARRGSGVSQVGGPRALATGINGSTIKPKH